MLVGMRSSTRSSSLTSFQPTRMDLRLLSWCVHCRALTLHTESFRPRTATVAECAPKFPFAGLAQRTHHQAQVHGHTHLRVLMITHDIARAWGPVMCTDAFFEQICIRIVRDLMDIRVNERDHPKILMWLLLPLYPSLAHSRAMRAHFICAFVSARMCSLCYDRIRKK